MWGVMTLVPAMGSVAGGGGGSGTGTVSGIREADGTPSFASVTILEVQQDHGFVLTSAGTGIVRLSLSAVSGGLISGSVSLASFGTSAGFAQSAVSAGFAQSAVSAAFAQSSTSAIFAQSSTSAGFAQSATSAAFAQSATSAAFAGSAGSATFAQSSTSAAFAQSSTSASFAQSSTSAAFSQSAASAGFAQSATSAAFAQSATSAVFAQSSTSAAFATNTGGHTHSGPDITASVIAVSFGGTGRDFGNSGNVNLFLKQISTGAAFVLSTISASDLPASSLGAPPSASYILVSGHTSLAEARVLSAGYLTSLTDGGAGSGMVVGWNPLDTSVFVLREDFLGGNDLDGTIGENGWSLATEGGATAVSVSRIAASLGHVGIVRLNTAATANVGGVLFFGGVQVTQRPFKDLNTTSGWEMKYWFRLTVSGGARMHIGCIRPLQTSTPSTLFGVRYDTGLAPIGIFQFVTMDGGASTVVSLAAVDSGWHEVRFRSVDSGTFLCLFDTLAEVAISTNLPTLGLTPAVHFITLSAVAKVLELDFAAFRVPVARLTG